MAKLSALPHDDFAGGPGVASNRLGLSEWLTLGNRRQEDSGIDAAWRASRPDVRERFGTGTSMSRAEQACAATSLPSHQIEPLDVDLPLTIRVPARTPSAHSPMVRQHARRPKETDAQATQRSIRVNPECRPSRTWSVVIRMTWVTG